MNRTLLLALGMVMVFVVTTLILSRLMPGPHKPTDYLVMGGVATLLCLIILFTMLAAIPSRKSKQKSDKS